MTGKHLRKNPTIALDGSHTKEMEIYPAYISKYISTCGKQITLLIIPNEKG